MAEQKVSDLTVEELKTLIARTLDERLQNWLEPRKSLDKEELQKIFDSVDRLRWTPPPGSPSTTELIREDRDR